VDADRFLGHVEHVDAFDVRVVPVKYLSTSDLASPTASKICDPVYDM